MSCMGWVKSLVPVFLMVAVGILIVLAYSGLWHLLGIQWRGWVKGGFYFLGGKACRYIGVDQQIGCLRGCSYMHGAVWLAESPDVS